MPVDPDAADVARRLGEDPALFAATGGEDYELLVAADPTLALDDSEMRCVGRMVAGTPGVEVTRDGRPIKVTHAGWDHLEH